MISLARIPWRRAFLVAGFSALAACPSLADGIEMADEAEPPVLCALPLHNLRSGTILTAGERLSAFWAAGDSLRPMVHARKPGDPWRLVRKPDPTPNGRMRTDWRLPVDLTGMVELRFSEPLLGKPLDSIRVAVGKPAGSEEMGPVLDSALEAAANDYRVESNFIPYRSAEEMSASQARLSAAEGGRKCLPGAAALRETARADARNFSAGLPILASRVRYHYRDRHTYALTAGEFRAVGFPQTVLASPRVLFMLDDGYLFSNMGDRVVRVEVRIGEDSLTVRRNAQREYVFTADGLQTVFLRVFTAKGDTWEQATVLEVPPAAQTGEPAMDGSERANAPDQGLDLAAGKSQAESAGQPARD